MNLFFVNPRQAVNAARGGTVGPITSTNIQAEATVQVLVHGPAQLAGCLPRLEAYFARRGRQPLSRHPAWPLVLQRGLGHTPYCLEAVADGQTRGFLALGYVRSLLFGRFLVSLPYLNYGGPLADDEAKARLLIDGATQLAQERRVRYLELRHEHLIKHPALTERRCDKVHMRLALPKTVSELWDGLEAKVRNQVRKAQKNALTVAWGRHDCLTAFYDVFSHNMRDLGTPAYGRSLFRSILDQFGERAELCVVRSGDRPVAAALLLHGQDVTEVPSASSLRQFNSTNANMLMYWHLLERTVQRGQGVFDFGRSTADSNTYRFKKQWGAEPAAAEWQYQDRTGSLGQMRTDNPRYQRMIARWKRLPLSVARLLGPWIARGIP
jgi:FemAB-related protein (PEP-CTERM system-associated)